MIPTVHFLIRSYFSPLLDTCVNIAHTICSQAMDIAHFFSASSVQTKHLKGNRRLIGVAGANQMTLIYSYHLTGVLHGNAHGGFTFQRWVEGSCACQLRTLPGLKSSLFSGEQEFHLLRNGSFRRRPTSRV